MLHDEEVDNDKQMAGGSNDIVNELDKTTSKASSKMNADLDAKGNTMLRFANGDDVPDMVEPSSIDWETVDLNAQNKNGNTALHVAIISCAVGAVKILLHRGANPYARNHKGETPLHKAVYDSTECMHLPEDAFDSLMLIMGILLNEVEDVNLQDNDGYTPLHLAARSWGYCDVESLLEHGSDINITTAEGRTAVQEARTDPDDLILLNSLCRYDDYGMGDNIAKDPSSAHWDKFYGSFKQKEVGMLLEQHVIKILALGCHVSEKNKSDVDVEVCQKSFYDECKETVETMKVEKIGNSNISYHEFLIKSIHQSATILRNRNIKATLEEADYEDDFQLFSDMIRNRFIKARKRHDLIDSSFISLNYLSGHVLTDYSSGEILSYLSNKDLENLIKAKPLEKQGVALKCKKGKISSANRASRKARRSSGAGQRLKVQKRK